MSDTLSLELALDDLLTHDGRAVPPAFKHVKEWACICGHGDSTTFRKHVAVNHSTTEWRHWRMSRLIEKNMLDLVLDLPEDTFTRLEWKWLRMMNDRSQAAREAADASLAWWRQQFDEAGGS